MVRPFTQAYYLIDYQLRKDFISRVLCINKQKPQLNCNGKCYLAKRLQAAEDQENEAEHSVFNKYETPTLICEEVTNLHFQSLRFAEASAPYTYANHYEGLFVTHIFHPPCQA